MNANEANVKGNRGGGTGIDEMQVNELTAAQQERLAVLTKGLAETQLAIAAIGLHGMAGVPPGGALGGGGNDQHDRQWTYRNELERAIGRFEGTVGLMTRSGDLGSGLIEEARRQSEPRMLSGLRHQAIPQGAGSTGQIGGPGSTV